MRRVSSNKIISNEEVFELLSNAKKVSASKKYMFTINIDGEEICYRKSLPLVRMFVKLNLNYGILEYDDEIQDLSLYPFIESYPDLEYLISKIPDLNKPDKFGKTAIFYAKSTEAIKTLIKFGADPNYLDYKGDNFLASLLFVPDVSGNSCDSRNSCNVNNENFQGECILLKHFMRFLGSKLSFKLRSIYYDLVKAGYDPSRHQDNIKKMISLDKNLYQWMTFKL